MVALIFLPGTIVHELSHLIIAIIFRVPAGELNIFPSVKDDGSVRAGSVKIARVDPFRQTIVGIAPLIIGLVLVYVISLVFFPSFTFIRNTSYGILYTIIGIYFLFLVTTTMFTSRKDLDSFLIVAPIITLLLISFYIAGVRVSFSAQLIDSLTVVFSHLDFVLGISAIVNCLLLIILNLTLSIFK
jgi:hypothetical protein